MSTAHVGKREVEKASTGENPKTLALIMDLLERAADAKLSVKNSDVVASWAATDHLQKGCVVLGVFQLFLLVMFAITTENDVLGSDAAGTALQAYNMFCGVAVMMFVGFGYLMTFLKWHGLSAVGFTMLLTAVALQWAVLTEGFFYQWMNEYPDWHYIGVNIYSMLGGLYAVSAVLITFGALIGKVTPLQLVIVAIIELCLHSLNYVVIIGGLSVADMGGTLIDHMFGAYFGLGVAYMMGKPDVEPDMGAIPDVFSLIGTVFLWIYWPSFVAGAADANSDQQQRALVYTILALSSSTVTAFFSSSFFNKNGVMRPVDIQNATLAGGVSIGCIANLTLNPAVAIFVGICASLVATAGSYYVQPYLEEKFTIHDTCGVHNLHGMTSIVGGTVSIIVAVVNVDQDSGIYNVDGKNYASSQWWRQLVGMLVVFTYSIFTGLVTGYILNTFFSTPKGVKSFHDDQYWEVAEDYGRTFYSELGLVVDGGNKDDLSESAHRAIIDEIDSSGHTGRRNIDYVKPVDVPASALLNEETEMVSHQA